MSRTVFLDAGPIGLLCAPPRKPEAQSCYRWLAELLAARVRVVVREIADYEVRRELLRAKKDASISRLDALAKSTEYFPLDTAAMRRAAEIWAEARQRGQPTAGDDTIDADVILAAQVLASGASDVIVATTNVGHLARFVPADLWTNILP